MTEVRAERRIWAGLMMFVSGTLFVIVFVLH